LRELTMALSVAHRRPPALVQLAAHKTPSFSNTRLHEISTAVGLYFYFPPSHPAYHPQDNSGNATLTTSKRCAKRALRCLSIGSFHATVPTGTVAHHRVPHTTECRTPAPYQHSFTQLAPPTTLQPQQLWMKQLKI
jgi:hypothetical protein